MGVEEKGYEPSRQEMEIEEEIEIRKELFDHNVNFVVEKFKDNPEKIKEIMESLQKIIDGDLDSEKISEGSDAILQERSHAIYEMRTFQEALKIIESEQK